MVLNGVAELRFTEYSELFAMRCSSLPQSLFQLTPIPCSDPTLAHLIAVDGLPQIVAELEPPHRIARQIIRSMNGPLGLFRGECFGVVYHELTTLRQVHFVTVNS